MTITQLQRLRQAATDEPWDLPTPAGPGGADFGNALKDAVERVDATQKAAEGEIEAFVAGKQENVHDVVIAMNEAKLSFQLMTQVRNRLLETYQELMRMQV